MLSFSLSEYAFTNDSSSSFVFSQSPTIQEPNRRKRTTTKTKTTTIRTIRMTRRRTYGQWRQHGAKDDDDDNGDGATDNNGNEDDDGDGATDDDGDGATDDDDDDGDDSDDAAADNNNVDVDNIDDNNLLPRIGKRNDVGNDCMLSVDGTDFQVAKSYEKPFYSYKFKKSGLRYEVALCIKTGDIYWTAGPYLPGNWNDDMIFKNGLVYQLEPGERCESDDGYRGSAPLYAKLPTLPEEDPVRAAIQQRVRNRQDTVNKRFKNWAILDSRIGPFLLSLIATSCLITNLFFVP